MTTYYARADGSAANKAAATGPTTSAAACMSMAVLNGETFATGDVIVLSSRGGNFTTNLVVPNAGTSGNVITFQGEPGFEATIAGPSGANILCEYSYIALEDMTLSANGYGLHYNTNTLVGCTTSGLTITSPSSEGVRHESAVTVTHSGLTISGVSEPLTVHAGGTITLSACTISDYTSAGGLRGAPGSTANWVIDGSTFTAAAGGLFISGTNISTGTYTLTNNLINDLGATRGWDLRTAGALTMKNNIIIGTTNGDFYILPASNSKLYNNTFIGNSYDPSNSLIFNNGLTGFVVKNNVFVNCFNAFFTTTGTIDYNLFYNSGTARGTNYQTTDPSLDANGKIQSTSSSAYNNGVGPSTDAEVPTIDIDGDSRSGATCDIGADEFSSGSGSTIDCTAGALAVAGYDCTISAGTTISCTVGVVAIAGQNATVTAGTDINCTTGAVTIAGNAATISAGTTISCTAGALTIAGQNTTVSNTSTATIDCTLGAIVLQALSVDVQATTTITVSTGAITIAAYSCSIGTGATPDGIDYAATDSRPHYTATDSRPHYKAADGRPHYTVGV